MSDDSSRANKLAGIAFGDALQKFSDSSDPMKDAQKNNPESNPVDRLIEAFEDASNVDDQGVEFRFARDLQKLLGYTDWRNFVAVLTKAKTACVNSGQDVSNHFVDVNEMVELGSGAERNVENTKLTRYASYLVAQNGDSRKKEVSFAQTYFAIQTRRQEIQDDDVEQYVPLSEDHKRVLLRDELKEHNKNLASAAKGAGVVEPMDFAIFQTFGYKGLYGGLKSPGIQRKKGLKSQRQHPRQDGKHQLAANLFRATQTKDKPKRDDT